MELNCAGPRPSRNGVWHPWPKGTNVFLLKSHHISLSSNLLTNQKFSSIRHVQPPPIWYCYMQLSSTTLTVRAVLKTKHEWRIVFTISVWANMWHTCKKNYFTASYARGNYYFFDGGDWMKSNGILIVVHFKLWNYANPSTSQRAILHTAWKYLVCSTEEWVSYRFVMTWDWVNDNFHFCLNHHCKQGNSYD